MSIFGTILAKVFGDHHQAAAPSAPAGSPSPSADPSAPQPGAAPASTPATPAPGGATPSAAAPASAPIDVAAVLDGMEDKGGQDLDWRKSIVDLMKLLGLDSSLTARKELAGELHYTGDTNDSASMNIWLHKEVMQKFTENGGKVPADLH
jgi:hypothetical protein